MLDDLLSRLTDGTEVVAGNGLIARQLETGLTHKVLSQRGTDATISLVESYETWSQALWREFGSGNRVMLSHSQAAALWRRTVTESSDAANLISHDSAASWAADAWQRLWSHELDPARLRAAPDASEFAVFLRWAGRYRETLNQYGWIDRDLAGAELLSVSSLAAATDRTVIWADMGEADPAQRSLSARLMRAGWNISSWEPGSAEGDCRRIEFADERDELAAAARWAAAKLAENSQRRLALVVPGVDSRLCEVERALSLELAPTARSLTSAPKRGYFDPRGHPPMDRPAIGAAFNALELMSHRSGFTELSRYLRSPFFMMVPDDETDRAIFERDLRLEVIAQLGFRESFLHGGLAQRMRASCSGTERRLRRGLELLTRDRKAQRATPTRWATLWQQILSELGWAGDDACSVTTVLPEWESALNDFCLLTPILGHLPYDEALEEFARILTEPRTAGPVPDSGLTLLTRPDDLAAGYDAVWIAGVTDTEWPRSVPPNPLLPLRLQAKHGMGGATPADTLSQARHLFARLPAKTPDLILSWPSVVNESEAAPSPLIAEIPVREPLPGAPEAAIRPRALREQLTDSAPALAGKEILGGAYTLTQQARSPLCAFIESRLGGRRLETVRRGLTARQRGIIMHRALELFLAKLPSRADLAGWEPVERREFANTCATRALTAVFGDAADKLTVIAELERKRLVRLLERLVEVDLTRPDFRIEAIETTLDIEISGYRLACRIDRIDSLEGGEKAVIDLKTGRKKATPDDWFKDRLRDTQLPLYAQAVDSDVSGLVLAIATVDGLNFKGRWSPRDAFPGNPRNNKLPGARDWPQQHEIWRAQLEALVAEYTSGDVRILLSEELEAGGHLKRNSPSGGHLAPLSRIHEQRALAEGWGPPWETS